MKGDAMQTNLEHKKTAELLAEAEELIRQINADALQYMKDDHQLLFRKHVEKLEKIKASAQVKGKRKKEPAITDSAEGMHAAIEDIVKAMREMTHKLT
jgi:stalled ribosome alternative rescue factor ArfA